MPGPPSRHHKPVMLLRMTDRDVVERAAALMDRAVTEIRRAQKHHKRIYGISLRGKRAVLWMTKLRLWMGNRRRQQIDRALACYVVRNDNGNATKPKLSRKQAARIRQRWAAGNYSLRRLGRLYGVSQVTVFRIVHNKIYKREPKRT